MTTEIRATTIHVVTESTRTHVPRSVAQPGHRGAGSHYVVGRRARVSVVGVINRDAPVALGGGSRHRADYEDEMQDPWKRAKNPATLPDFSGPDDLRAISDDDFEQVLRDHLEPSSNAANYVKKWRSFWNLLAFDQSLADRATRVIEQFVSQTEAALNSEELDEAQDKRAVRFRDRCIKALDRLDRADEDPLAWAGAQASVFNPRSREVIAALVNAIAQHRDSKSGSGSAADRRMWAVLRRVHLDPDDYS